MVVEEKNTAENSFNFFKCETKKWKISNTEENL